MTIDTNELRRLAQAATPGPWYVTGKLTRYVEARIDGGLIQEVAACGPTKADGGYGPQQEANARLIAAANPATISEILDRLEAAESARGDDYQNWMTALDRNAELLAKLEAAEKERDALQAKIEAMEKQEPVYLFRRKGLDDFCTCSKERYEELSARPRLFEVKKLYALPGAQPASSVPDVPAKSLKPVIDWLRNGCDPQEAAKELEILIAAAPEAKPCGE